ncbi:MAG: DUF92 domain-containing protein [Candidatus Eremiobacteraeota bacterium]|nr:DUF92 domain-containing protein [Candidatus Eremiobacteraeota bacterium]MBC5803633.1 DUF92 domain-containing protein [Candidatus Eremiobacteraeota bacterium]
MRFTLAPLSDFDIAAVVAATIALIAYRTRSLDSGGALAAWAVGTASFGALGTGGAAVLLTFFTSSVLLSRLGRARKRRLVRDVAGADAREASQVFANGAIAALCALATLRLGPRYAVAFAGACAAANADTWGSEIGTLVRRRPRSILTARTIATGLSGGVTWAGTVAEIAGACVLAAVAMLTLDHRIFVAVTIAGMAGALVDSLLGASLQALRWCPYCSCATEREPHACGANTRPLRGIAWLGNDGVNFAATLTGAAVAYLLAP